MAKYECDNSDVIKLMKKAIEVVEPLAGDPQKKKELNLLKMGLKNYLIDCSICKRGNNDLTCLKEASTKLQRQLPFIRNSIYPWKNYDWDYGNFIDNNFSAKATGSSPSGRAYMKNMWIFLKFLDAYITAANPNHGSVAGGRNRNSDFPIYGCTGNAKTGCNAWHKVKSRNPQRPPYADRFFNKQLKGEASSSYFAKVGECPRPDITSSKECIKRNFVWKQDMIDAAFDKIAGKSAKDSGFCSQPRYIYLNNKPGLELKTLAIKGVKGVPDIPSVSLGKLKGFVPSLANDLLSLTPDKLFKAFSGKNVPGHMIVQPCPRVKAPKKEKFSNYYNEFNFNNIDEQNESFLKLLTYATIFFVLMFFLVKRYV
jgi:hypothetical protein